MYSYQYDGVGVDGRNAEEQSFLLRNVPNVKFESPSRHKNLNNNWDGQWIDDSSPQDQERANENSCARSCMRCVFPGRTFSEEWEQLADSFIHPLDRQRMSLALFLLFLVVSSLSVIELIFQLSLTVHVMCNMVFSFCFIVMLIFVCTPYCKQRHFLFVRIMTYLSCLTYSGLIMPYKLPFATGSTIYTPGDRLWELFFVILVVYVFIPLPYLLCLLVGIVLPVAFATTMIFQWEEFDPLPDVYVISANMIVLAGAGNLIGIVAWCMWNRFTRRLLVHVREYALAGVELEKENEKFDRVLAACFPANVGVSLKADILNSLGECTTKDKIVNHESVTMMLVELVGFDRVLTGTLPRDKGVLINKFFTKLCELSEGYACACLNADNGWTMLVVSGIIHTRSDHARACLHLAFDMLDFVNALSDTAGVPLRLRITVHSGGIACGLVGKQRWVYDAWSHDLVAMQKMHDSAVTGQVQISRETLAFFGNASDIQLSQEPNVMAAAAIADRFVVRPNRPPRLYGFTDVLSSYPDRHLLAPTQLLIAALDSTSPLNCTQFPMFGQIAPRPSPIQLLTAPVRLPDEEAFALNTVRQLQEEFGSGWTIPTVTDNFVSNDTAKPNSLLISPKKRGNRDLLNPFTMRFRSRSLEQDFEESSSSLFTLSLISCLAIHTISTVFHCLVLPQTVLFLTLSLLTFVNFLLPLFAILCNKLGCFSTALQRAPRLRLGFCVICLVFAYLTAQLNVLTCSGGLFDAIFVETAPSNIPPSENVNVAKHRQCPVPIYIGVAGLLVICMPMLFTRILALVKAAFALMVALGFALVIEYTHRSLFVTSLSDGGIGPSDLTMLVSLAVFVVVVYVHGRLLDRLERLTLLWQRTCAERHVETSGLAQQCRRLLNNVLPEPALTCLVDSAIPMDSYSENQDNVAVAVLVLENLPQPSSLERRLNSTKNLDSFRLLSQLIYQIDELLSEGRFKDLVKVRSVGSQYVIAVGLYSPESGPPETMVSQRLSVAIDFVLAVRQMAVMTNSSTGSDITVHSGISIGSVTCGVVACRTIYFDIFSNTVRTALQMARSCKPEYVQVSETVYTYTRYLYRYYSRKRMNVDPIGEFFAYRLIGTRAMYRNGPLGLGPLIGGGLTRQGSRESGVSLLSQATSVWSQAGGPGNRQFPSMSYQQKFVGESASGRPSINGDEEMETNEKRMSAVQITNSLQSDQNGHYATTATNPSYASYYAGPNVVSQGPYQYASAYVAPYRETGRNANASQLSAVPEMDTSGHEHATALSSNNSGNFETAKVESQEEQANPQKMEPRRHKGRHATDLSKFPPPVASGGSPMKHKNHNGILAESSHNSPLSQVSHYDNQNGLNGGEQNGVEDDIYLEKRFDLADFRFQGFGEQRLSEMPDVRSHTIGNMQNEIVSPPKKSISSLTDPTFSQSSTYSLPQMKAQNVSHQSLKQQLTETQLPNFPSDVSDIDERLAALDELDRRIRESVAQLRCVENVDTEEEIAPRATQEQTPLLDKSWHRVTEEFSLEQPVQPVVAEKQASAIPFIDDSSNQTPKANMTKGSSKSSSATTPGRQILPDLVRPPTATSDGASPGDSASEIRLRSRSADHLLMEDKAQLAESKSPGLGPSEGL